MYSKRNICDRLFPVISFRTNQSNYLHVGFQFSFIVKIASCNVEPNEGVCKSELCCIHECKLVNSRQGGGRTSVASVRAYVCLRLSIPIAGLLDPPNPDLAPAPLPRHTCTAEVPHELRPRRDATRRSDTCLVHDVGRPCQLHLLSAQVLKTAYYNLIYPQISYGVSLSGACSNSEFVTPKKAVRNSRRTKNQKAM